MRLKVIWQNELQCKNYAWVLKVTFSFPTIEFKHTLKCGA